MTDRPKKLTPEDLDWVKRQLANPNPIFLVAELVTLAGPNVTRRRLWRMLIRKGVIEVHGGKRHHMVPFSRLLSLWPEFWLSVRRAWSEAGLGRREADLVPADLRSDCQDRVSSVPQES